MEPKIWGRHVWTSMHYIALGLPENPSSEDKEKYYAFYMSLKHVLPCQTCSDHLKKVYEEYPLRLSTIETPSDLFEWTVKIHNEVNKKLNKPIMELSEATKLYSVTQSATENEKKQKPKEPSKKQFSLAIFILCFLLLTAILIIFTTKMKSNTSSK